VRLYQAVRSRVLYSNGSGSLQERSGYDWTFHDDTKRAADVAILTDWELGLGFVNPSANPTAFQRVGNQWQQIKDGWKAQILDSPGKAKPFEVDDVELRQDIETCAVCIDPTSSRNNEVFGCVQASIVVTRKGKTFSLYQPFKVSMPLSLKQLATGQISTPNPMAGTYPSSDWRRAMSNAGHTFYFIPGIVQMTPVYVWPNR
jgi:hypothetical protein